MRSNLPLEVLGLMGPVLSWIEGTEGLRLPQSWLVDGIHPKEREQGWLLRELPTYSYDNVDEILKLRRKEGSEDWRPPLWVKRARREVAPPADFDLMEAFGRLGERYFRWNSSELRVQEGRLEELHELALRFPVAHLIRSMHARVVAAGHLSAERALDLPEHLSLLHTSSHGLWTVVHRGVSEGHMHLWGVMSADEVWADHLLEALTPEALKGFSPEERRLLVLSRACVRLLALGVLFASLWPEIEEENASSRLFSLLPLFDEIYLARNRAEEREAQRRLREAFRDTVDRPESWLDRAAGREETGWLLRLANPLIPRLPHKDGAAGRLADEGIRSRIRLLGRLHFTVQKKLLELPLPGRNEPLKPPHLARELLHQAFFRYLIYHTHHWQLATQSGKTTGLRQFQRFFNSRQRRVLPQSAVEEQGLILERLRHAECLRHVEGRISLPGRPRDLVPWILGYAQGVQRKQLEGFGFVIHFLKASRGQTDERAIRAGGRKNRVVRYGRIRRKTRDEAFRLFRLLSTPHPAVPFLVGIDAANLELPTPPEVFAPAFRFLREYPIETRTVSRPFDRFGTYREILSLLENRRLGMTYHVGEEFRHLLSGLRAIAETIEFLAPRPGDRLGHAIALAVEPEVWAEQIGYQAVLPKQEWLDTLVWVHHFLGSGYDLLGGLGVEDRIQQLSRAIYGASRAGDAGGAGDWPIPTLHDAWSLRQLDPYSVDLERILRDREYSIRDRTRHGVHHQRWADVQARVLAEVNEHVGSNQAYKLLRLYWYHSEVRKEGDRITTVDMQPDREAWLALCHAVQEKMKTLVRSRELVVEVNPSSNRIIGPFAEMSHHHVFRMTLNDAQRLSREIRVTVNTDDPGVFNTSLAHEYYLLGEILLRKGMPEAEVMSWLDWLRGNGNDACFVRALPEPGDPRIEKILTSLQSSCRPLLERLGGERSRSSVRWESFWEKLEERVPPRERDAAEMLQEFIRKARSEDLEALARALGPSLNPGDSHA
ncbi:MAG TPA: hypothetical protein VLQ45_14180 [Thermoanaerobaculia bacterium]|nr:hypothetical protein [Thermoanaerobaculia bacterium]